MFGSVVIMYRYIGTAKDDNNICIVNNYFIVYGVRTLDISVSSFAAVILAKFLYIFLNIRAILIMALNKINLIK